MAKKKSRRSKPTPSRKKDYLVFISHATHDKWIAKVLCEKCEEIGAETFRDDRDIKGGDSIPDKIKEKIIECDEFLVLLTPESVSRQWVVLEIGMAFAVDRRIVPLFYHIDVDQIPDIIKSRKGFSLNDLEDYLSDLKKRMKT